MTDDETTAILTMWEERLKSKEPMQQYIFDLPLEVTVGTAGELTIDCPCYTLIGFDRAGIVRIVLTPGAANMLRHGLAEVEKIQDEPGGAPHHATRSLI